MLPNRATHTTSHFLLQSIQGIVCLRGQRIALVGRHLLVALGGADAIAELLVGLSQLEERSRSAFRALAEVDQARYGQIRLAHFQIEITQQLATLIPGVLILAVGEFLRLGSAYLFERGKGAVALAVAQKDLGQ